MSSNKGKSLFIGSLCFMIFAVLRNIIPLSNMPFYILACVIFVVTALASYFFLVNHDHSQKNSLFQNILCFLPPLAIIIWMILFYINEPNAEHPLEIDQLIRRSFPLPVWIGLMILGTCICLFLFRTKAGNCNSVSKIRKYIRLVITVLLAIGTSIQFYAPNIFQDIQGGTYHSHAYTSSIINVCWLTPYSEDLESLYGHYAILYMPFLKLMHKFFTIDYLTGIFILCAILAGISVLLFAYVLNYFIKNDVIFYLALFGIGEYYFMLMQGGVYMQVHPHRMIFPILLTALAVYEQKKQRQYPVLAVLFITLSFVWSTEVGLVIMLAFSLLRWYQAVIDTTPFSVKKVLKFFPYLLLYTILPFALSYLIVNAYNLLAGGSILDFSEFMFPLISDRGYIDQIELPLPNAAHPWTVSAILFLIFVCIALFALLWHNPEKKEKLSFFFFFGTMGLGLMLYYTNRAAEGSMFIVLFFLLILQALILQKSQDMYLIRKTSGESAFQQKDGILFLMLRIITTFILFAMAFDCIYSMPKAWKTSSETIWKRAELQEFADYLYDQVPPDAVSFGEGVPEIMSMIDRDTHLHTTEWSYLNMPLDTMERNYDRTKGSQWIFCSLYSLWYLQENYPGLVDNYELHEQFEYNGAEFGFFVKLDE